MKTTMRRIAIIVMAVAIVLTAMNPVTAEAATKKKAKLNKKSVELTITGKTNKLVYPTVTLKMQNVKKTVKCSTSNKKIATVKKTGKYSAKVTAKGEGTAKITAKVGGKKYTCKVTVKDASVEVIKIDENYEYWSEGYEQPLGVYLCNCGYAYIPVYESGLGRGEQRNTYRQKWVNDIGEHKEAKGPGECTAEEWNAHMAEHRENGESTDYKDTVNGPKPLGRYCCKCGYQMFVYVYGWSEEEYATWDAHIQWHSSRNDRMVDYNYSSGTYKHMLKCLWKSI